jgi:L-2-hydroxyglutarate oxidase LhgO
MDNRFDVTIIGAGIVGLAIAEELSKHYNNILVVEKEGTFGQHVSSRNSEVIHSGFYYPPNSLKSKLCVKGNEMMYSFARKYNINHRKCGKLIVANKKTDYLQLESIMANAIECGLENISILNKIEAQKKEPMVNCLKALWIPSTGIIDSHSVMSKLEYLSKDRGVFFAYKTNLNSLLKTGDFFELEFKNTKTKIISEIVINSSGLWSDTVSKMLGINNYEIEYYKGDYYKSRDIKNLNCLIYPIPKISSLGIHSVLSLNGEVSFGTNIYKVKKIDTLKKLKVC